MLKKIDIKFNLILFSAIFTILFFLYILNLINYIKFDDIILGVILFIVFSMIFLTSLNMGFKINHPYIIYLLIFFLYQLVGFFYSMMSDFDFFKYPFGYYNYEIFNYFVRSETFFSLIFFLISFHIATIFYLIYNKNILELPFKNLIFEKKYCKFGIIFFIFNLIPAYYCFYIISIEAFSIGGYREYIQSNPDGLKNVSLSIKLMKDFFIFGYWLYLSGMPNKKNLILPTFLYLLPFLIMSIATGSRVIVITQIFALFIYFSVREKLNFKYLFLGGISLVFISLVMGIFRTQIDYDINSAFTLLSGGDSNFLRDFILQQGSSALTISLTAASIANGNFGHSILFLLEPLYNTSTGFIPFKSEFDYFYLADRLAYLYTLNFEFGDGLGSSIVAEFYSVGGVLGVIFLAMSFGLIFSSMLGFFKKNNSRFLIFLFVVPGLFYTPRSHPFSPLIFNKNHILISIFFIFIYKIYSYSKLKYRSNM